MREKPSMLRREVSDATHLVRGDVEAAIVYPGGDIAYKSLAQAVRAVVNQHTGISLDLLTDTDIINKRDEPFPEDYQNRPLIVLGSINTNRVLLPLYARFFCATDAAFPGGAGYELRTMVNPYGTESNIILLGGSTIEGVGRAVRRFIGLIDEAAEHDTLTLPFLLEVEPGIEMARRMAEWPDPAYKVSGDIPGDSKRPQTLGEWPSTSRDMPIPETDGGLISVIGPYAILYAWTGERKYGQYAADCLRKLNTQVEDSYGDWHYAIERIVRAVPWLASGGFLDADERRSRDGDGDAALLAGWRRRVPAAGALG